MMTSLMNIRALGCLLVILGPTIALGGPQDSDIVGAWICGPYEMQGPDLVVSAIDRTTYSSDGKLTNVSSVTYTSTDGKKVRFETRQEGTWTLKGDVIEMLYTSGTFLGSDSPTISMAAGQASVDAQMQRKNWAKARVLEYGERLVTVPVEAIYKEAEVRVSCSKA